MVPRTLLRVVACATALQFFSPSTLPAQEAPGFGGLTSDAAGTTRYPQGATYAVRSFLQMIETQNANLDRALGLYKEIYLLSDGHVGERRFFFPWLLSDSIPTEKAEKQWWVFHFDAKADYDTAVEKAVEIRRLYKAAWEGLKTWEKDLPLTEGRKVQPEHFPFWVELLSRYSRLAVRFNALGGWFSYYSLNFDTSSWNDEQDEWLLDEADTHFVSDLPRLPRIEVGEEKPEQFVNFVSMSVRERIRSATDPAYAADLDRKIREGFRRIPELQAAFADGAVNTEVRTFHSFGTFTRSYYDYRPAGADATQKEAAVLSAKEKAWEISAALLELHCDRNALFYFTHDLNLSDDYRASYGDSFWGMDTYKQLTEWAIDANVQGVQNGRDFRLLPTVGIMRDFPLVQGGGG